MHSWSSDMGSFTQLSLQVRMEEELAFSDWINTNLGQDPTLAHILPIEVGCKITVTSFGIMLQITSIFVCRITISMRQSKMGFFFARYLVFWSFGCCGRCVFGFFTWLFSIWITFSVGGEPLLPWHSGRACDQHATKLRLHPGYQWDQYENMFLQNAMSVKIVLLDTARLKGLQVSNFSANYAVKNTQNVRTLSLWSMWKILLIQSTMHKMHKMPKLENNFW